MGGICEICGCDLTNSNRAYYEQYYNQKIVKVYYDVCKDCHDKKSKHPLNRHERRKIKALRGEEMAENLDDCLDLLEMMIGKQHSLADSAIKHNVEVRRELLTKWNAMKGEK